MELGCCLKGEDGFLWAQYIDLSEPDWIQPQTVYSDIEIGFLLCLQILLSTADQNFAPKCGRNRPIKKLQKRAKFLVKNEFLYIANDGRTFDRKGIIALSITNLSTKSTDEIERPEDPHPDCKDLDFVDAYSKKRLELLSADVNQLVSGGRGEEQYCRDYSGRWLLETLQNIDDALGPNDSTRFIGTKGLGFLSLFELGEFVQIYSGAFNFEFCSVKTTEALTQKGIKKDKAKLAAKLYVPWPAKVDDVGLALKAEGYATVIRLKLFDEMEQRIEEEFRELQPHFLLLSQNISSLEFESKNYCVSINRSLKAGGKKLPIKIQDIEIRKISGQINDTKEYKKELQSWRRWSHDWDTGGNKRAGCAICLPLKKGAPIPAESCPPLYNFYPTEEKGEVRALMHATFELSGDRKHLQMHGDEKNWEADKLDVRNEDLIKNLSDLVRLLCRDNTITLENKLTIFKNIGQLEEKNKDTAAERIKSSICKVMTTSRFIPTIYKDHCISIPEITFSYPVLVNCFSADKKLTKKERENPKKHFHGLSNNDNKIWFAKAITIIQIIGKGTTLRNWLKVGL